MTAAAQARRVNPPHRQPTAGRGTGQYGQGTPVPRDPSTRPKRLPGRPEGVAPRNIGNKVTPPPDGESRSLARSERYRLLTAAQAFSDRPAVRNCRRVRVDEVGVSVQRGSDGNCWYTGLATCSSVWECAVCAHRRKRSVANEIQGVVHAWQNRGVEGATAYMLTLTVRHGWNDDLARLHSDVMAAWKRFQQGKSWKVFKARYGVETIRSVEVTHGPNGFHPHIHCLVLVDRPLPSEPEYAPDDEHVPCGSPAWFKRRWEAAVLHAMAEKHMPRREYGAVISPAHRADYLSKMSLELADPSASKTVGEEHRTPWQILGDAWERRDSADNIDRWLWRKYAAAMAGRRFVAYSKGLRSIRDVVRHQLEVDEAAEHEAATEAAFIWRDDWDRAREVPWFRPMLLDAAESGSSERVRAVLSRALAAAECARAQRLAAERGNV